jgi:cation diffusion facilitator CzcD-associated flavoprotein CzcO
VHRVLTGIALRKLAAEVRDEGVRAKLTPDYELGCKRVLVSDDYWPAFNRANVELVTEAIGEVTAEGIRTADGRVHECDVLVLATGFTVADPDGLLPVIGLDGRVMEEEWRVAPEAFLGIHAAGYPNLSLLLGPNSGLGHSSALHVMESQMVYIGQYLEKLAGLGPGRALDVKREAQTRFSAEVQDKLRKTVWASGCRSWYMNRAGRNTAIFPGLTKEYRRATERFDAGNYRVVERGG